MQTHVTIPRAVLNMQARMLDSYAGKLQGEHRDSCDCTACEVARELREDADNLRIAARLDAEVHHA